MISMHFLLQARWMTVLASVACAILAVAPLTAAPLKPKRPLVVAHRGGRRAYAAFDNAVRLGVGMIEFDMEMTSDDQLIVQHDGTVNATFCTADPGSAVTPGPVRQLTLAELGRFDCGSKHRDIYPNQIAVPGARMPTLPALLDRYRRAKVTFFGEAKMPGPGEAMSIRWCSPEASQRRSVSTGSRIASSSSLPITARSMPCAQSTRAYEPAC
jgi:glycerophosphoryl diester phosphodiesterase